MYIEVVFFGDIISPADQDAIFSGPNMNTNIKIVEFDRLTRQAEVSASGRNWEV